MLFSIWLLTREVDLMEGNLNLISYAQNLEDVILWRVLHSFGPGFYIDVGACDPVVDSVTKAFYDAGWNGINIEPMDASFERVARARKKDINLKLALGAQKGNITFYSIDEGNGLSTPVESLATKYIQEGRKVDKIDVEVETLANICERYVNQDIHFLKIDVEGSEQYVLEGANFVNYRPWIILIESTEPNTTIPSYSNWEPIVLKAGYCFVYFDGLNRFYVANEKMQELKDYFSCPPNFFDHFEKNNYVNARANLDKTTKQFFDLQMNIESLLQNALPDCPKEKTLSNKIGVSVNNNISVIQLLEKKETELLLCQERLSSLIEEGESYKSKVNLELDACYQELYESSRHIGVLTRDRNNAMAITAIRDATIVAHSRYIQELEQKIHALHSSMSWKITRPMRFLSQLVINIGLKK